MSAPVAAAELRFAVPLDRIATAPLESAGGRRDDVRLLVARRSSDEIVHARFRDLPSFLEAGDVVVVNTSATLAAALPAIGADAGLLVHLSTRIAGGRWVVELRRALGAGSLPWSEGRVGQRVDLAGGGVVELVEPFAGAAPPVRLWVATVSLPRPREVYLARHGRPIRYGGAEAAWPLSAYQTVFALHPGSAEMPSAGRAFTSEVVTELVSRGVVVAPLVLHTGVSSQEPGEPPYAERYRVGAETADVVNDAQRRGRRVIAVGTTATRALESAADAGGVVHAADGWTELVITPARGVRVVDGLISGWHEPAASHLQLLEAVAGRTTLARSYAAALAEGYRWHHFGDLHLILP